MAWLETTQNGYYQLGFWFDGERFKRGLNTNDERQASALMLRVDENISLVERGRLIVPDSADIGTFLLSDGKLNDKKPTQKKRRYRTLKQFAEAFLDSIPEGSLEESTLKGMEIHLRHLQRLLGASFILLNVELEDLQTYVDDRSKEKGRRGKKLSPATIKKELTTLRTMWNWAKDAGYASEALPLKGLRYPKRKEKPPFQTLAEIEKRIARGGLTADQEYEFWSALFLTTSELEELLEHVRSTARHEFLYPMFVFAAHTGARRSEMLRSELDDIDFLSGKVTIREKKRVHDTYTTRLVPMSPLLRDVLKNWISSHPGGIFTFTLGETVSRSKKKRVGPTQLTVDEAHDHFRRAVAHTKWENATGWHLFRHSFCSNCAAAGIDQRIINSWVGHQTEEMVKRYRHLVPDQQQRAIEEVFAADGAVD